MNLTQFVTASVIGVPLLFVVFILVEILKRLTKGDGATPLVTGNGILLGSLGIGLVLGIGYQLFANKPPVGGEIYAHYVYWFAAVIYGLSLGGLASIFYEALKGLVDKAIGKLAAGGLIGVIRSQDKPQ